MQYIQEILSDAQDDKISIQNELTKNTTSVYNYPALSKDFCCKIFCTGFRNSQGAFCSNDHANEIVLYNKIYCLK